MNMINISVAGGVPSPVEGACGALSIGNVGDNGATSVLLDFSAWAEEYGAGAVTLGVKRKGDAAWYPVALTVEDGSALWIVSNVDTAVYGIGEARFAYTVGEVEKRSAVFRIFVDKGLGAPESTPPDPYENWVERLEDLGAETLQNAQDAAESAADAETAAEDAATSATVAEAARVDAQQSAEAAAESAVTAKTAENGAEAACDAALTAKSGAEAARDAAVTAKESAEAAHVAAMQSASEAEGYAGDAETAKNAAEEAAEHAEQAASTAGYMFFYIDARGHLIYQRTSNTQVDFYLENGHLYVEAIA